MKKNFFITILILFIPAAAHAVDGGEAFAFMKLGVGSRATGMGGAYSSIAEDTAALFYNPAGAVGAQGLQLSAETYFLSFGRSMNYIAAVKPFAIDNNRFSAGIAWLNYSGGSDIEVRSTNSPDPEGTISETAHAFLFTAAAGLTKRFYAGATFKILVHNIGTVSGSGIGFDAGVLYRPAERLDISAGVMNINSNLNWESRGRVDIIPWSATGGASYRFRNIFGVLYLNLIISGDVLYSSYGYFRPKFGAEAEANRVFYIRGGYNGSITMGVGIKLEPSEIFTVKFDYAFLQDNIINDIYNQRLSVCVEYIFPHRAGVVEDAAKKEGGNSEAPW